MITEDTLLQAEATRPGTLRRIAHAAVDAVYKDGNRQWLACSAADWAQGLSEDEGEDERTDALLRSWGYRDPDGKGGGEENAPDRPAAGTAKADQARVDTNRSLPDASGERKRAAGGLLRGPGQAAHRVWEELRFIGEYAQAIDGIVRRSEELGDGPCAVEVTSIGCQAGMIAQIAADCCERLVMVRRYFHELYEAGRDRTPNEPDDAEPEDDENDIQPVTSDGATTRLPLRPGMRANVTNPDTCDCGPGTILTVDNNRFVVIQHDPEPDGTPGPKFGLFIDDVFLCVEQPTFALRQRVEPAEAVA